MVPREGRKGGLAITTAESWREVSLGGESDLVKRFVYQYQERATAESLQHVLKQLPRKPTVQGMDSPHTSGHHFADEILIRGPLYSFTSHFTEVAPNAPIRGSHRHIQAPMLFSMRGRGWEWNDGETYLFDPYDLLVVPPYAIHQHGGDRDIGCEIYVPEVRLFHTLGIMWREQHKVSEKPTFPDGTEPLYDEERNLIGYRLKKGILGITEDIDVMIGRGATVESVFQARRSAEPWTSPVENTYDRYLKLMHDESTFCQTVDHVIREADLEWEWTRHGKLKWLVDPETETAACYVWMYFQEIEPGSRSGLHRHLAEETILVLEGHGYDLHDGERWDWEQGDLIYIPSMVPHQHFATGDSRALLLSSMPSLYSHFGLGGIEQLEDAPEFEAVEG